MNKHIAVVTCLYCKFWNRPEGWAEFRKSHKTDEPYDWSEYRSECSKLPDIDHVGVELAIHGDASVDVEISTCGTFGCPLGEVREAHEPSKIFKIYFVVNKGQYHGPFRTDTEAFDRAEELIGIRQAAHFEVEYIGEGRFVIEGKVICTDIEYCDADVTKYPYSAEYEKDNNVIDAVKMLEKYKR